MNDDKSAEDGKFAEDGAGRGPTAANDAAAEMPEDAVPLLPEERIAALETELADAKDRLLRTLAETENVRRRLQREREDAQKYAVSGFAKDLLGAADNLRRALEAMPEAEIDDPRTRSLLDGVAATERELLGAFERHGLKRIDPKGERFDHNFHQAIFEAERPGAAAGTVIEVLQPGYVLHERLLRPAMVGVAKGSGDIAV
ncbi:MAG TPA: nucleotide exchange factor GrpE [Stellaceae bacterium]|jgi:molecular chaperone GrpE|nr:nucleotide exchange factor GrpE [Stellaceae bacterium]